MHDGVLLSYSRSYLEQKAVSVRISMVLGLISNSIQGNDIANYAKYIEINLNKIKLNTS
jgi:hypothetical protein